MNFLLAEVLSCTNPYLILKTTFNRVAQHPAKAPYRLYQYFHHRHRIGPLHAI